MQDLSSYQSDPINTGSGTTQPAPAQHRTRTMMRSKSESYKGEETLLADCFLPRSAEQQNASVESDFSNIHIKETQHVDKNVGSQSTLAIMVH